MPDSNPIQQLQQRLLELGCPVKATRHIVHETAEHFEDLQKAALTQGLPSAEATAQAARLLGDPKELAERHVETLRKSSWWGRNPALGFGVLPLLFTPVCLLSSVFLLAALAEGYQGVIDTTMHVYRLISGRVSFEPWHYNRDGFYPKMFEIFYIATLLGLPILFGWLVRRRAIDHRWQLVSGAMITLSTVFLALLSMLVLQVLNTPLAPRPLFWDIASNHFQPFASIFNAAGSRIVHFPSLTEIFLATLSCAQPALYPMLASLLIVTVRRWSLKRLN